MYGESLTAEIPESAVFVQEENGVKWYTKQRDNTNTINYMQFEGRVLQGGWVGPRWVFQALVSMSPEERAQYSTHDEFMGAIGRVISSLHERK